MKTKLLLIILSTFALSFTNVKVHAHCQIPCGIYEDTLRIQLIAEHITTIEKSMNQIIELSKEADKNYNQIVRWVNNKEEHAIKIQEVVSQYFLHQRVKIVDSSNEEAYAKYHTMLELLHKLSVYSMKCKQTTDLEYVNKLREVLIQFEEVYFHEH